MSEPHPDTEMACDMVIRSLLQAIAERRSALQALLPDSRSRATAISSALGMTFAMFAAQYTDNRDAFEHVLRDMFHLLHSHYPDIRHNCKIYFDRDLS